VAADVKSPPKMTIRTFFRLCFCFLLLPPVLQSAETPKSKWKVMKDPAKHGWSSEKLKAARDFAKASGSSALMVVEDGVVVD